MNKKGENMNSEKEMKEILLLAKTIAAVGLSSNPAKESFGIVQYLKDQGYRIIPVNPAATVIMGEKAYPDLSVDVVQVFRKPEDVPPVVDEAIKIRAKVVWMQEGIVNEEAAQRARDAGLTVVMDACMRSAHRKFLGAKPLGL
jgi:predicted CoA-binding protein